jgi:hypothetical protein
VISCKPAYARALRDDMANATVYVPHTAAPTPAALDAAAGTIAGAFNTAATAFGAKASPERMGFFAGMPKLHKPRLGWRFLTCSLDVCTTPLAKLLNTFLRALLPVCGEAWAKALARHTGRPCPRARCRLGTRFRPPAGSPPTGTSTPPSCVGPRLWRAAACTPATLNGSTPTSPWPTSEP